MERFMVLGFSFGCSSESSVGVGVGTRSQPKRPNAEISPTETRRQEGEGSSYKEKNKSFSSLLSIGIRRLIRGIKNFSQLFVYKEEMEAEMEIGFPTDVKHVTHIGLDGSSITNHEKGWENIKAPEIISFPSISLKQFEVAMDAQVHGPVLSHPSTL